MLVSGTIAAQTPDDLTKRAIDAGDVKKAFELIDKALDIDPEYAPAYIVKAGIYAELDDYDAAFRACDKAIEIAPHYREAYEARALLKEKKGDIQGAKDDRLIQQKLIQEGKSYWLDKANKDLAQAEEALKKQQALQGPEKTGKKEARSSRYAKALLERARAKLRNGDYKEAIEDYNRYQQTVQLNSHAFTGKAYAQKKLNDFEGAIKTYTELLSYYPEITTFYEERAKLYEEMGEKEKAERDRAAVKYLHWKNKKESEETCTEQIKKYPDRKLAYLDRANFRIQLGNYEGAIEDYQKAKELSGPEDKNAMAVFTRYIESTQKKIKERDEKKILEKQAILDQGEALVKEYKKKNLELQMQAGQPQPEE